MPSWKWKHFQAATEKEKNECSSNEQLINSRYGFHIHYCTGCYHRCYYLSRAETSSTCLQYNQWTWTVIPKIFATKLNKWIRIIWHFSWRAQWTQSAGVHSAFAIIKNYRRFFILDTDASLNAINVLSIYALHTWLYEWLTIKRVNTGTGQTNDGSLQWPCTAYFFPLARYFFNDFFLFAASLDCVFVYTLLLLPFILHELSGLNMFWPHSIFFISSSTNSFRYRTMATLHLLPFN